MQEENFQTLLKLNYQISDPYYEQEEDKEEEMRPTLYRMETIIEETKVMGITITGMKRSKTTTKNMANVTKETKTTITTTTIKCMFTMRTKENNNKAKP